MSQFSYLAVCLLFHYALHTIASDEDYEDEDQYHTDPKFKFRQAAAHIRRGLDLFSNIHTLVNRGMMRHALDHDGLPLSQEDGEAIMYVVPMSLLCRSRLSRPRQDYETFVMLLKHIPGLREEMIMLSSDPAKFRKLNSRVGALLFHCSFCLDE